MIMKTINYYLLYFSVVLCMAFSACNSNNIPDNSRDNDANLVGGSSIVDDLSNSIKGACGYAFTVSSSGNKVYFSKGNLQYKPSTKQWRFADNQYDVLGREANRSYNRNEESSHWLDLFVWGSGEEPLSTSECYFFKDWGGNPILNTEGSWRTLIDTEWEYLVRTHLCICATVCDVKGVLLFPEYEWELPKGITYELTTTDFATNVYSTAQWQSLERIGCIFLPVTGLLFSGVYANSKCRYWTWNGRSTTCYLFAFPTVIISSPEDLYPVRLVQDVID
ncbi:MAG: hypothetical protein NC038_08145 [Paludibacter sp.]|nr:hypothetical protein [Bacteroidales bacterium]MCM1069909.1 hypothetical protein [Prevotella sp.]MCM1354674.1 hypothetical protein [Bacteroides sp.]MCM1443485.1 hypothetical protein [Muribaculum sp.]MCM1482590.1 hypothetical protein [Paludibacter sp.]